MSTQGINLNSEKIHIDLSDTYAFSPYVFGHNLEHTRACLAGGLSAQILRNRKFAGKPSKNEGCAADWCAIGGTNAFFCLYTEEGMIYDNVPVYTKHNVPSEMQRINEIQSLVVQNLSEGEICGICQHDIAVKSKNRYELRMTTQCNKDMVMKIQITDRTGNDVYAEKEVSLVSGDWKISEFTLKPERDDTNASIRFTFSDHARVNFGVLSMLPEGHFLGMRRDVIECLKEIGTSILRWPGGNFAGEYRWQDGLLPVDMRAPLQAVTEIETQPFTHGYDNHEIGTDEFIALCREVGAEPFITINAVWNTPEENAAWVEYCNGTEDTKYGRLRAERGHKEPYNVKFWSLGNEMGYPHMEGPKGPERYAPLAKMQANAMLDVSPDLELFSSGPYPNQEWADKSAKVLAPEVQYASLHYYSKTALNYSTLEDVEKTCKEIFAAPETNLEVIKEMRACLGNGIHISFDEWNCWYAWYRPSSVPEGIYAARMLHMLMHESERMDMPVCCYFQPVGEGAIEVKPNESSLTGIGQAFSFLKCHKGGQLCRIENINEFDAAATIKEGVLTVTLINTDLSNSKLFLLNECGQIMSAEVLCSDSVLPHSRFEKMDLTVSSENGMFRAELPAHSIAKIIIRV